MSAEPTLRERAIEGARQALCTYDRTDGFCTGDKPDCRSCSRLGAQIGVSVLRHIRPTLRRLMLAQGDVLTPDDVLALIDEATA